MDEMSALTSEKKLEQQLEMLLVITLEQMSEKMWEVQMDYLLATLLGCQL